MDYFQLRNKKRKRNPHATRMFNKAGLLLIRISLAFVIIAGVAGLGAGIGIYRGILNNAPNLYMAGISPVHQSSFILSARTGEVREVLHGGQNFEFASIDQMPRHLLDAFVAIEDERFFEHNGVDFRGIVRALYVATLPGRATEGASTITQQLVKNMLGIWDNDFISKLQEQYLARNFENHLTEEFARQGDENPREAAKYFILQSYLNIINLGRTSQGVQAAAWFYYGVDVSELTIAQSATIAAITQNPTRFPPDVRPHDNWRRTRLVLRNMHRLGFITDEEYAEARQERQVLCPETGEPRYDPETGEPVMLGIVYDTIFRVAGGGTRYLVSDFDCFTDALIMQVRNDLMREYNLTEDQASNKIFTGGLQIFSTQNVYMQGIVDSAFLNDSLWPGDGVGFSIEVTYQMTVYNTITQQRRFYRQQRVVSNLEEAEAFIQDLQTRLLTNADIIESERTFKVPQPQGAFVLIDHHTGHVLAMRGVRGEKQGNRAFNRATQATRSPGSQMKPLVPFGPLFELGVMQPSTVVDDIPFELPNPYGRNWTPSNHWEGYRGLSTVRNAIYASGNIVAARAAADPTIPHAGMPAMIRFLEDLGISTIHPHDGPAIVLGGMTEGVKLIELAGAYAAVANLGEFNRPALYTVVLDHEGNILLENPYEPQRVMRATTAYLLTHSMQDTVTRGTGGLANWENRELRGRIPIAGKTGTSERRRDLGFAGFTPYFTAVIWLGNDNEQPMHTRAREFHTPLWRHIMEEIHQDLPARFFERPSGIVTAYVCLDSGHLATECCRKDPRGNRVRSEVFAMGHVPTQYCNVHRQYTYCTESGMLAGHNCHLHETVVTRVGIVRPIPIDHIETPVLDRQWEFPLGVRQGLICTYHGFGGGIWGDTDALFPGDFGGGAVWNVDSGQWIQFPNTGLPPTSEVDDENGLTGFTGALAPQTTPTPWPGLAATGQTETTETTQPFVNSVPIPGLN